MAVTREARQAPLRRLRGWRRAAGPAAALCLVVALLNEPGSSPVDAADGRLLDGRPSAASVRLSPVPARPNWLVIEADDMRVDELRWMPRTRRLLARRGLRFENSFANSALCCPSRASFLSGQLAHNHEVLSHERPFGFRAFDDARTLATALRAVGYRTALVGKYLNGYGIQRRHDNGQDSLHYVPPGWSQWYGSTDRFRVPGQRPGGGTYMYFNLVSNVNGRIRGWPGQYSTRVTATQTRRLVRRFSAGDRPWFVWWTPLAPHHGGPIEADDPGVVRRSDGVAVRWLTPARPRGVRGRFDDVIARGAGIPPDGSPEADVSDKPRFLRRLPPFAGRERRALTVVTRQRAEALSVLDRSVASTLAALRRGGDHADTMVLFTSDNGYFLGEHRRRQGKLHLHEPSVRVPLLVAGPGVPRGRRYDPVTTVDLSRTIAAYAGARLRSPDGANLRGMIESGDGGWRRPVALEGLMPGRRYTNALDRDEWPYSLNTVAVRTGRWKLVRYATGERELYDLAADPLELESLRRADVPVDLWDALVTVADRVAACSGRTCRAPLPERLRLDPGSNRAITAAQARATRAYYGD